MPVLAWIITATAIAGLLSAFAASLVLLLPRALRTAMIPHFVSFAIGTLLGAAFLALIPHAITEVGTEGTHRIGMVLLAGILLFFLLEKLVLWRHCHHGHDCEAHAPGQHERKQASAAMVLFGDAMHNLVDGALIAAAFLTDIHLGVMTAAAVIAHEIPQELGDFGVLLDAGWSRTRAFLMNLLPVVAVPVGGLLAWAFLADAGTFLPYTLALAAASFIYVAVADLIPGLHERTDVATTLKQVVAISLGVGVVVAGHALLHG